MKEGGSGGSWSGGRCEGWSGGQWWMARCSMVSGLTIFGTAGPVGDLVVALLMGLLKGNGELELRMRGETKKVKM